MKINPRPRVRKHLSFLKNGLHVVIRKTPTPMGIYCPTHHHRAREFYTLYYSPTSLTPTPLQVLLLTPHPNSRLGNSLPSATTAPGFGSTRPCSYWDADFRGETANAQRSGSAAPAAAGSVSARSIPGRRGARAGSRS